MFACIHGPQAAVLAGSFSPWVESVDRTTAVFSLTPRQAAELQGGAGWNPAAACQAARSGPIDNRPQLNKLPHNIAVASTIETAVLAARSFPGITYIAPGEEGRVLGGLSVDSLPLDLDIFKTLDLWGIRTLADLARLPEDGLMVRLGARGLRWQKLVRGTLARPLKPELPETVYEASAELDHPLELREPLLFLIGRFIYDLAGRLQSQSLAAQALHLRLNRQERVLKLPFPTRDVKFLIKLVEHSLERQPPEEAVEKVFLRIEPTQPRRVQHGLFTLAAPEPEKLELTLGKIRGLVGAANVVYPKVLDTHRPGSGPPDTPGESPYLAFRYFRPPLEARVEAEAGMPRRLRARGVQGAVIKIAGPWRTSGDWWRPDFWNRDEWDLLLSDGALYRLVSDRSAWFVEGTYD